MEVGGTIRACWLTFRIMDVTVDPRDSFVCLSGSTVVAAGSFFLPKGLVSDGIMSPQVVLRRHSLFVHDDEAENIIKSARTGFLS